jgi:CBS domain containing-hemolysin-like protein
LYCFAKAVFLSTMMNWYLLIWIGVSMLMMGFFAGLQSAFGALNRFSVELKKKQGAASGRILSFFIDNQSKFIGAVLVGSTLTLVVFALLVNRFFQPVWKCLLQSKTRRCYV